MTINKKRLRKGSGFFKQQQEENVEEMKKKRAKARVERNKTLRRKKNVSTQQPKNWLCKKEKRKSPKSKGK